MLIMDDLNRELGPPEDLEDDNDSSDDTSSKGGKKSKLPLVNPMCVGEFYSMYLHTYIHSFIHCSVYNVEPIRARLINHLG